MLPVTNFFLRNCRTSGWQPYNVYDSTSILRRTFILSFCSRFTNKNISSPRKTVRGKKNFGKVHRIVSTISNVHNINDSMKFYVIAGFVTQVTIHEAAIARPSCGVVFLVRFRDGNDDFVITCQIILLQLTVCSFCVCLRCLISEDIRFGMNSRPRRACVGVDKKMANYNYDKVIKMLTLWGLESYVDTFKGKTAFCFLS